jgi:hypothetical protein
VIEEIPKREDVRQRNVDERGLMLNEIGNFWSSYYGKLRIVEILFALPAGLI